ncbi:reverse transcriptase domain-containing protein [Tanacetum coccineum]|uniref:Reverse transcriptase domain-containing protein n=1 Tax=Tanacetum coccineum TaxID=301880 RepID=A0ABQ4YLF6_9ASTR
MDMMEHLMMSRKWEFNKSFTPATEQMVQMVMRVQMADIQTTAGLAGKGKYQPSDCPADPSRQPPFSRLPGTMEKHLDRHVYYDDLDIVHDTRFTPKVGQCVSKIGMLYDRHNRGKGSGGSRRTRYNGEAEGVEGTVGGVLKQSKLPAGDNRPQCDHGGARQGLNEHNGLPSGTQIQEKQLPKEKYPEEAEPFSSSKRDVAPEAGSEWKEELVKAPIENWPPEKAIVNDDYPDQPITIGGSLSAECRTELTKVMHKYADAFVWVPADMTGIPCFIIEHQLKTYPHIEPRVQKKKSLAPNIRKVVKEKVEEWLKSGIVKRPINQILNCPEASGRLAKCVVELGAYDISYSLSNTIEGQVLADFLADIMAGDDPSCKKAPKSKTTLGLEDVPESSKAREEQTNQDPIVEVDVWKLYTDGASNDHGSRAGLTLIDPEGMEYSYTLQLNLNNSNNYAKYEALLAGLRIANGIKVKNTYAFVDLKLVASQVKGSYEAQGEKTKKYMEKVLEVVTCFDKFQISHKPREQNKKVDTLSKLAAV